MAGCLCDLQCQQLCVLTLASGLGNKVTITIWTSQSPSCLGIKPLLHNGCAPMPTEVCLVCSLFLAVFKVKCFMLRFGRSLFSFAQTSHRIKKRSEMAQTLHKKASKKLAIKLVADMFRHQCHAISGSKGGGGLHHGQHLQLYLNTERCRTIHVLTTVGDQPSPSFTVSLNIGQQDGTHNSKLHSF